MEVRPVLPPCSIPAADSIYDVVVEVPIIAPNIDAPASIVSSLSSSFYFSITICHFRFAAAGDKRSDTVEHVHKHQREYAAE